MSDKWTDRVAKLMAKAEDPATTPEEAEAFMEKAEGLILSMKLDRDLVAARAAGKKVKAEKPTVKTITFTGTYLLERMRLMHRIGAAIGTTGHFARTRVDGRYPARPNSYKIFGYESDIETVEFLYASLNLQMIRAGAHSIKVGEMPYYASQVSYLKGFYNGFSGRTHQRLVEIHKKAEDALPGAALVVLDRAQATKAFFNEETGDLKLTRTRLSGDGIGDGHGRNAANRADLNQTKVGGSRVQIGH
jgi:hypothetical protein